MIHNISHSKLVDVRACISVSLCIRGILLHCQSQVHGIRACMHCLQDWHLRLPTNWLWTKTEELFLLVLLQQCRKRQHKWRRDVRIQDTFTQRRQQREFHNLVKEMCVSDPQSHFRYLSMSKERFDEFFHR